MCSTYKGSASMLLVIRHKLLKESFKYDGILF